METQEFENKARELRSNIKAKKVELIKLKESDGNRREQLKCLGEIDDLKEQLSKIEKRLITSKLDRLFNEAQTCQATVDESAQKVASLKASGAGKEEIAAAVNVLKEAKAALDQIQSELRRCDRLELDREALDNLLVRRYFLCPSYEIYGGVAGLYDLGPPGCGIKTNILDVWRKHFIVEENMLEIETASVAPEVVLTVSGHVEKFQDFMVRDTVTGDCHRADHILEDRMDQLLADKKTTAQQAELYRSIKGAADSYSVEELGEKLREYGVKAPFTGNDISDPFPFNLMFQTQIGPKGTSKGFLRPETAQGIFVNFGRLLDYNQGKLPFAGATIGPAFRNEIAPRQGLIRVREFTLAEIEHFVFPDDKSHPKFENVRSKELILFPREQQETTFRPIVCSLGNAVEQGIIANECLAYFMGRTQDFLYKIGIHRDKLRFRQHRKDEMAHYACDCWDAEILTTYGWVECVGLADRSCYDLTKHGDFTKTKLRVYRQFPGGPRDVEEIALKFNDKLFGTTFKKDAKVIKSHLAGLSDKCRAEFEKSISQGATEVDVNGTKFTISSDMVSVSRTTKKKEGEDIIPSVIEPSFGIGRILYALLEHSFSVRPDDAKKSCVSLPPAIAPLKCAVLPLEKKPELMAIVHQVAENLRQHSLTFKLDDASGNVGKKYVKADEVGIPYAITIDFDSLKDNSVTVRERDSTTQTRLPVGEVAALISRLVHEEHPKSAWRQVVSQHGEFVAN